MLFLLVSVLYFNINFLKYFNFFTTVNVSIVHPYSSHSFPDAQCLLSVLRRGSIVGEEGGGGIHCLGCWCVYHGIYTICSLYNVQPSYGCFHDHGGKRLLQLYCRSFQLSFIKILGGGGGARWLA